MERRMIQSDVIHWVTTLSTADKEVLATKDRSRSLTAVKQEEKSHEA